MKTLNLLLIFSSLFLSNCHLFSSKKEIQWFKGDMKEALVLAKKQNRPLFVYWGAVWCPPCNVIKSTTFKDGKFIEATGQFIPVYLDGDTESAQEWGEKLKARGYPTLMVLDPSGSEVLRLSTSMSSLEMAETLSATYNHLKPITETLNHIVNTQTLEKIADDQWKMIANYSWSQDSSLSKKELEISQKLFAAAEKMPQHLAVEKARLSLIALLFEIDGTEKWTAEKKKQRLTQVQNILASPKLVKGTLLPLSYYSDKLTKTFFDKKSEARTQFISTYKNAIKSLRYSKDLSYDQRLSTLFPMIDLSSLDSEKAELSAEEQKEIQEVSLKTLETHKDKKKRAAIVSDTSYLLLKAGKPNLARDILKKELKSAVSPYYVMSSLAYLEKQLGNKEEAISWSEKSYMKSEGQATRVQWGSSFLRYMMDLTPKKKGKIFQTLDQFYSESLKLSDAFMGRNKRSLERLSQQAKKWAKENKVGNDLKKIQKKYLNKCSTLTTDPTQFYLDSCKKFFSTKS